MPSFDLIIVDEAHHIRNTDTWSYKNSKLLLDNAKAALLLTATPIQMQTQDLFNLLRLVRPDLINSASDFNSVSEPNPYINSAIQILRDQPTDL